MNPLLLGGIVETVGNVIDDLVTTDKERLDAEIELRKLGIEEQKIDASLLQGQQKINEKEAEHHSIFVAGWRPAVGWVGVAAMFYQFLLYPLLIWLWAYLQATNWIPVTLAPPPILDTEALWVILTGILGLGTARTVEKLQDKARKS
jgi:hypothetical protein